MSKKTEVENVCSDCGHTEWSDRPGKDCSECKGETEYANVREVEETETNNQKENQDEASRNRS